MLNRILKLEAAGLTYEADPRRAELLVQSMAPGTNSASSQGIKADARDRDAVRNDEQQAATLHRLTSRSSPPQMIHPHSWDLLDEDADRISDGTCVHVHA